MWNMENKVLEIKIKIKSLVILCMHIFVFAVALFELHYYYRMSEIIRSIKKLKMVINDKRHLIKWEPTKTEYT